ncbi:MAG: RluA family pseudouridine synthase [Chordicoccus sp.]
MSRILTYTAGQADAGRAVRDVIRHDFRMVAHDIAAAKYRTEHGITVNGEDALVNRVLKDGDVVRVKLVDGEPGKIVPVPGGLSVLYEDEDVIALNKPAGLVVHPSHGHFADTLSNFLADYYIKRGEPHEVRSVGRLDKDTSGVILFGKSRTACAHLTEQAEDGRREKYYLALASGTFRAEEKHVLLTPGSCEAYHRAAEDADGHVCGEICAPISREYIEKIRRVVRSDGDFALTHYRVLRQFDTFALVRVTIATGRTHQIRVHMGWIGHPLLGDPIYGRQAAGTEGDTPEEPGADGSGMCRAALHAYQAVFRQPFSGERIELTAPLPEDMRRVIEGADQALRPGLC